MAAKEDSHSTETFSRLSLSQGKLILQNETDGTEHIFSLKGIGKKPLALDHIVIDCQVRQNTQKVLMVPNFTKKKLTYKVNLLTSEICLCVQESANDSMKITE